MPLRFMSAMNTQRLVIATLLAAHLGGGIAVAGSASAEMVVRVSVIARTVVDGGAQQLVVDVTPEDISRGHVDVPAPFAVRVRTNSPNGYMLQVNTQGEWFRAVELEDANTTLRVVGGEAFALRSGRDDRMTMRVRVVLQDGVAPGRYVLPLTITGTSA